MLLCMACRPASRQGPKQAGCSLPAPSLRLATPQTHLAQLTQPGEQAGQTRGRPAALAGRAGSDAAERLSNALDRLRGHQQALSRLEGKGGMAEGDCQ